MAASLLCSAPISSILVISEIWTLNISVTSKYRLPLGYRQYGKGRNKGTHSYNEYKLLGIITFNIFPFLIYHLSIWHICHGNTSWSCDLVL